MFAFIFILDHQKFNSSFTVQTVHERVSIMSSFPGKLHTLASAPSAKVPVKKKKKGPVKLNAFGYDDDSSATESGDEGGLTAGEASHAQTFQSFGGASSSWQQPPVQHASSSGAASSSVLPRVADHELFSYHDAGAAMRSR